MAKSNYFPVRDGDRLNWSQNLKKKIVGYQTTLALTDDEMNTLIERCDGDISQIQKQLDLKTQMQKQSKEKQAYLDASQLILRKTISRVKTHPNYTPAIGEDLNVVGNENIFDPTQMKPVIKAVQIPQGVLIKWIKGNADAINIYVDRKDGEGFIFLATDTQPDYLDAVAGEPIPDIDITVRTSDYQAVYVISDTEVGKTSDKITITVPVKK